ncbi:hypothetical protein BH10ACI4_BH10ACI4_07770 [soil metagenome]
MREENLVILESTLPAIRERGMQVAQIFYRDLLSAHPELKPMFSANDQDSGAQAERLAKALIAYVGNIRGLDVLGPAVTNISRRHVKLHVVPEQYPIVGQHLLGAIKTVLGDVATPEVIAAWAEAYQELADLMIARESEMYADQELHSAPCPFN